MLIVLWIVAIVLVMVGLAGVLLPVLPGPPLVLGGIVVLAGAYRFERISVPLLIVLAIVTALLVLVDAGASAVGAKRFGGTWRGALGASIGALVGLLGGPVGLVLGAFVGAVLGETLGGKDSREALKAGTGAMLGLVAGAVVKMAVCLAMLAAALGAHFFWN